MIELFIIACVIGVGYAWVSDSGSRYPTGTTQSRNSHQFNSDGSETWTEEESWTLNAKGKWEKKK